MVHRPKIETLSEYTAREYGYKDSGSGAVSGKIKKAKQACNLEHINTKSLTESQLKQVKEWIFDDALKQHRKEFFGGDSEPVTQNDTQLTNELNIAHCSSDTKQTSELNLTQFVNDAEPATKSTVELDLTQNDSRDKFISINYRHADNSRHTVQIEQFYIDALIAIGITDISRFVAENAGTTTVTKNVKRAIVNELVKRAIGKN